MAAWAKPISLAILGAEKAGTTTLFRLLEQSSTLAAHPQAEMTAFVNPEIWEKGESWIHGRYFPTAGDRRLLMKDVMLMGFADGLHRLKESSPEVRVIVVLREPAARAWSAFHYARSRGIEPCQSFSDALLQEPQRIVEDRWRYRENLYLFNSTYAPKVRAILELFGTEQTLVLYQHELRDIPALLRKLGEFCGHDLLLSGEPKEKALNKAARARSQTVARVTARVFQSRGPMKRALRAMLPTQVALKLRRLVMNLNRTESENPPMPQSLVDEVRARLYDDALELQALTGSCPWLDEAE